MKLYQLLIQLNNKRLFIKHHYNLYKEDKSTAPEVEFQKQL